MRAGFAISVAVHAVALFVALVYAGASPFDSVPAQAITVDIVTPDDLAEATKQAESAAPDKPFDWMIGLYPKADATAPASAQPAPADQQTKPSPRQPAQPQQARQSPQQQSPQAQQPQQPQQGQQPRPAAQAASQAPERNVRQAITVMPAPQPEIAPEPPTDADRQPANFADIFAMPIALPDGRVGDGFDAAAYEMAKIAAADRNAFRDHVKSCAKLPASLSPGDKIRIVLRVVFKPDGTLATAPTLIEASASAKGPALMQSAIRALRACQPYTMLPPGQYSEWKSLDLTFTPEDLGG